VSSIISSPLRFDIRFVRTSFVLVSVSTPDSIALRRWVCPPLATHCTAPAIARRCSVVVCSTVRCCSDQSLRLRFTFFKLITKQKSSLSLYSRHRFVPGSCSVCRLSVALSHPPFVRSVSAVRWRVCGVATSAVRDCEHFHPKSDDRYGHARCVLDLSLTRMMYVFGLCVELMC